MRFAIAVIGFLLLAAPLNAEDLLVDSPKVRSADGGYEISFVLAKPSDVTMRVVDARGEVVRHLACGMVGLEKAAKPFAPNALAQKIIWDGKDNDGKPVAVAECSVCLVKTSSVSRWIGDDGFLAGG